MSPTARLNLGRSLLAVLALSLCAAESRAATEKAPPAREAAKQKALEAYGTLPMRFEPNQGQSDPQVKFLARGQGFNLFLTPSESVLVLGTRDEAAASLRFRLLGANTQPELVGSDPLPGKSHYLRGSDPKAWHANVPQYGRVTYRGVYRGVDLTYYGNEQKLEYDFVLAPKVDPGTIRFQVDGAERVSLSKDGDLVLTAAGRELLQRAPVAYQTTAKGKKLVKSRYFVEGRQVGFKLGSYDKNQPLYIDPVVLIYSTFLGGSGPDRGQAVAVDFAGNAYVTGQSGSADFPNNGSPVTPIGQGDAFVIKLDAAGSTVVYSTFVGGTDADFGEAITVDSFDQAWVAGTTQSLDFPTTGNAFDSSPGSGGASDGFAFRLSTDGSTVDYGTYISGGGVGILGRDNAHGVAVDSLDNAYVTGQTFASDFPSFTSIGPGGERDAYVVKINGFSGGADYSTRIGSSGFDESWAIAVDSSGAAYITGQTQNADFPAAFVTGLPYGGFADAFVAKLNPSGSGLDYTSFLGGAGVDIGRGIAVNGPDAVYVTGDTESTDFPTSNAFQGSNNGLKDAFVARFNSFSFGGPVFSTFLGGSDIDIGRAAAIATDGSVWVAGNTRSASDFPTLSPLQAVNGGGNDAFAAKLDSSGNLLFSTYLGGSDDDVAWGIAPADAGNALVAGETRSSADFPILNAVQPTFGGGNVDPFLAKLPAALDVTFPNGGEVLAIGSTRTITWSHSVGSGATFDVEKATNAAGTNFVLIGDDILATGPTTGAFDWTVTGPGTSNGRIRVTWTTDPTLTDTSDAVFQIANPNITITSPANGNSTWAIGTTQHINYNHNLGPAEFVRFARSDSGTGGPFLDVDCEPNQGTFIQNTGATTGQCVYEVVGPVSTTTRFRVRFVDSFGVDKPGTSCATSGGNGCDISGGATTDTDIANASITVSNPGTANWTSGDLRSITWSHNLGNPSGNYFRIELSDDSGATFSRVIDDAFFVNGAGSFPWTVNTFEVGSPFPTCAPPNTACPKNKQVRVKWVDQFGVDKPQTLNCDAGTPTNVGCDVSNSASFRILVFP